MNLGRITAGIVLGGLVGAAGTAVIGRGVKPATMMTGGLLGAAAGAVVLGPGYEAVTSSYAGDDSELLDM